MNIFFFLFLPSLHFGILFAQQTNQKRRRRRGKGEGERRKKQQLKPLGQLSLADVVGNQQVKKVMRSVCQRVILSTQHGTAGSKFGVLFSFPSIRLAALTW